jgi:sulfite reductase alpha subunit-like flavoprotein
MKNLISLLSIIAILFSSCQKGLTKNDKKEYVIKGKEIAQATVKELGSNLMKHMKEGGPQQAIPFCNASANPLTEEIAKKYNVSIKRTSHKIRNDDNKPNEAEETILKQYFASISNNEELKPIVSKDEEGKVHFYAPIKLEAKCLACHGTIGQEVSIRTDSILKVLYPNDKATGFKVGDLRGIVNITFKSE